MKRYLLVLFFLLALTAVCHSADEEKFLLQYNPTLGTATTYKIIIDGETIVTEGNKTTKTKIATDMSVEQRIIGKDENGNITMENEILANKLEVNGKAQNPGNVGSIVRVVMAQDGTIISQSNNDSSNNNFTQQIKFPNLPIGIGDTWSTRVEANSQLPIPMETVYTIAGFENYEGEKCVKIKSKINSKNQTNSLNLEVNAEGNIYFSPTKGILVGNQVVSKMNMITDNRRRPIKTEMSLKLKLGIVKSEIKKDIITTNNTSLVEDYDFNNDPFFKSSENTSKSNTNSVSTNKTKSASSLENLLKERKEKIQQQAALESNTSSKVDDSKEKERLKQLLKKFRKHEDKLEGVSFYRHPVFREDGGREFYPYIGVRGNFAWLRVFIQYKNQDWLFVESINAYTDFGSYKKQIQSSVIHREVRGSLGILENADCSYDYDFGNIFENLAKSKKTASIRYMGSKYYEEKNIRQNERDAIAETLELKNLIDKYGINN